MTGHVIRKERGGKVRWHPVTVGEPDADGKRPRAYHGESFETRKEAKAALAEILKGPVVSSRQSFGRYLEEWLAGRQTKLKPSTWDAYNRILRLHVVPALGMVELGKLSAVELNAMYAALEGKGLSAKSIRNIHTMLHRALKDAARWDKVARNVAALAEPPAPKKPRDFQVWLPEQVQAFLAFLKDDRLYAMYHLALTTGMRRGELLGLGWNNVNLDAGWLAVRDTLICVDYVVQHSAPKTERSRRTLALDPGTVAVLKAHRKRQLEERLIWPGWTDNGLLFVRENGEEIHPQSIADRFKKVTKDAGVPPIRFHDLSHTYATLALESGMKPWDLSDRLGHASVAFTLDTYRHAIQRTQDTAAVTAAAFIVGGAG